MIQKQTNKAADSTSKQDSSQESLAHVQLKKALTGMSFVQQQKQIQLSAPFPSAVQARGDLDSNGVKATAAEGFTGGASALPHLDNIQNSFGNHDVSNVQAHVGGPAEGACASMGASAYASGNNVAFSKSPDLHTAAHEAAHVVQQREGVQLAGGVGKSGDQYEQHADAVADKVTRGQSAGALLDMMSGGNTGGQEVQRQAVQFDEPKTKSPAIDSPDKITADNVEKFQVKIGDFEAPLSNELLTGFFDSMYGTGTATSNTQFAGQALVHTKDTFQAQSALKKAIAGGQDTTAAITEFKKGFSPTMSNAWKGAKTSTKINMGVDVVFKLADGTYAKMNSAQISADLAYTAGKSIIAESAATVVGASVTAYCALKGGAIGTMAGPIGVAVGFAVGAAVGALMDYLVSDKIKARLADFFGAFTGETGNVEAREDSRIAAMQDVVDETISNENPVVKNVDMMSMYMNKYEKLFVGIDKYELGMQAAGNRGTSGDLIRRNTVGGFSSLATVRSKWAFWTDKHVIVQDFASAKSYFENVATFLSMGQADGAEQIMAAEGGRFKGPNAARGGRRLSFKKDDKVGGYSMPYGGTVDPISDWRKGMEFANQLNKFMIAMLNFCHNQNLANPLSEQLKATYGWAW